MYIKCDKDTLESTLNAATFAAERHEKRKDLAFKIFISFMTLIALCFWKVGYFKSIETWILFVVMFCITSFYTYWQFKMSVADSNDVERRNFYLNRHDVMMHYASKNKKGFYARSCKDTLYKENKKHLTETELFRKRHPNIPSSKSNLDHLFDWGRVVLIFVPILSLILFLARLLSMK